MFRFQVRDQILNSFSCKGGTPTDMSSEIEAGMEGMSLGEGSDNEDWENLFRRIRGGWIGPIWACPVACKAPYQTTI